MDPIDVGGLQIAYERSGAGPPLVLVHGYVGDGPSTWRPQLDALADEFTVIVWDAPGAGRSSDPEEDFGMAGYADCLMGFITRLELATPHVVGLSFGAAMVIELCRRHPSVPASVTLASGYAGWAGSLPPHEAERRLRQALDLADGSPAELVAALLPTMFAATASAATVAAYRAALLAFHPAGLRAMARAVRRRPPSRAGSCPRPDVAHLRRRRHAGARRRRRRPASVDPPRRTRRAAGRRPRVQRRRCLRLQRCSPPIRPFSDRARLAIIAPYRPEQRPNIATLLTFEENPCSYSFARSTMRSSSPTTRTVHHTGVSKACANRPRNAESRPRRTGSDLLFSMVAGVGFEPTTFGL